MAKGVGLRPTTKVVEEPPNPKARAPRIYPDCCRVEVWVRQEKLGKGGSRNAETFHRNPAGNQPRPAELGRQPETSLAWSRSDPGCEA